MLLDLHVKISTKLRIEQALKFLWQVFLSGFSYWTDDQTITVPMSNELSNSLMDLLH